MIRGARLMLAVGALGLAACGSGGSLGANNETLPTADEKAPDPDTLPDVEVESLDDDSTISLTDIEGPAVVNLWATWCAPCRREIPDFEAVHVQRGGDVTFVGINIGESDDRAAEFIDDVGATYSQYLDPTGEVVTELRTTSMPVTFVIDANGVVTTKHLGPMDQGDLNDAIDEAIHASG
jgi:thiol-disulfide isomerase/thioredoxin